MTVSEKISGLQTELIQCELISSVRGNIPFQTSPLTLPLEPDGYSGIELFGCVTPGNGIVH